MILNEQRGNRPQVVLGVCIPRFRFGIKKKQLPNYKITQLPNSLQVRGLDLARLEYRQKWRRSRRFLYCSAPFSLFALDEANRAHDLKAKLSRRFDGLNRRSACGAGVVYDHDSCAFLLEAFDPATHAVGLFGFANQEAVDWLLPRVLGAQHRDSHNDRISAHRESADCVWRPALLPDQIEKHLAGQVCALRMKRRGPAIDVVVALASGGEYEVTTSQGSFCD